MFLLPRGISSASTVCPSVGRSSLDWPSNCVVQVVQAFEACTCKCNISGFAISSLRGGATVNNASHDSKALVDGLRHHDDSAP